MAKAGAASYLTVCFRPGESRANNRYINITETCHQREIDNFCVKQPDRCGAVSGSSAAAGSTNSLRMGL